MNDEYWIYIELWVIVRVDRLLRSENNPDGRNVIELESRECDECNGKWMMNIEYILNDDWLWKIYDRLLRLLNTPDGRDVIELEYSECDEWNDKWMMNIEYVLNDE